MHLTITRFEPQVRLVEDFEVFAPEKRDWLHDYSLGLDLVNDCYPTLEEAKAALVPWFETFLKTVYHEEVVGVDDLEFGPYTGYTVEKTYDDSEGGGFFFSSQFGDGRLLVRRTDVDVSLTRDELSNAMIERIEAMKERDADA